QTLRLEGRARRYGRPLEKAYLRLSEEASEAAPHLAAHARALARRNRHRWWSPGGAALPLKQAAAPAMPARSATRRPPAAPQPVRPEAVQIDPADPLVSVIIPTYNRAALAGRALDSVLSQEFGRLEVLIVDDGSSEDIRAV